MDEWPLLDISDCSNDVKKIMKAWNHFNSEYILKEVRDPLGSVVSGFNEGSFKHVISGSSDYRSVPFHDLQLVDERLVRIPWIGFTLNICDCNLEIRKELKSDSRNRKRISRLYLVVDKHFMVVLDEGRDCCHFRTAYPITSNSIERNRKRSTLIKEFKK